MKKLSSQEITEISGGQLNVQHILYAAEAGACIGGLIGSSAGIGGIGIGVAGGAIAGGVLNMVHQGAASYQNALSKK